MQKIQEIVSRICKDDFRDNDIGMLFIWLRSIYFKQPDLFNDPILYDISNFIAHHEERDEGASFNHIRPFVENLLAVYENDGKIIALPPVFRREDVLLRLVKALKALKIDFSANEILNRADSIIDCIKNLLDEGKFKFEDPRVIKCYIKKKESEMYFCVEINHKSPSPLGNGPVCSNFFD